MVYFGQTIFLGSPCPFLIASEITASLALAALIPAAYTDFLFTP